MAGWSEFWTHPSDSKGEDLKRRQWAVKRFFSQIPPDWKPPRPPPPPPDDGKWPQYTEENSVKTWLGRVPLNPAPVPKDDPYDPVWPQASRPDDEGYWHNDGDPYITLNGERTYLRDLPNASSETGQGYYDAQGSGNGKGRSFIQMGDRHIYLQPLPDGEVLRYRGPKGGPKVRDL